MRQKKHIMLLAVSLFSSALFAQNIKTVTSKSGTVLGVNKDSGVKIIKVEGEI